MISVTPPQGVRVFVNRFGGRKHLRDAATSMGVRVTYPMIADWIANDAIPDYIYHLLAALVVEDETQIAKGFIEFYVKGKPVGKFFLHRDVTAVIRKSRT